MFVIKCRKNCRARRLKNGNIIRRTRFACWINKVTDTHSDYVIRIAFPRQQWSLERTSIVLLHRYRHCCTGRFIMFSVITNIHNKKNQRIYLNGIVHSHRKTEKVFLNKDLRRVHHRWHGTDRYDMQVLATHASTWVHRYSSLLQWSVQGTDHCSVPCAVSPVVHTSNISSFQKTFFSFPVAVNNSIKVGPLVFLLSMFVFPENIMKLSVFESTILLLCLTKASKCVQNCRTF
jgi:hypothetical protein